MCQIEKFGASPFRYVRTDIEVHGEERVLTVHNRAAIPIITKRFACYDTPSFYSPVRKEPRDKKQKNRKIQDKQERDHMTMKKKKLPIGIENFEELQKEEFYYVDKTDYIPRLEAYNAPVFLRPRRFGKSLLLSTIEAYLSGKKELFKGLAIEKLEQKWEEHPILHLDLNTENYKEPDSLRRRLDSTLSYWEQLYGTRAVEISLPLRFEGIVRRACEKTGHRVVILVDEYDKPMLQAIGNETLQAEYRTLRLFTALVISDSGLCTTFAPLVAK